MNNEATINRGENCNKDWASFSDLSVVDKKLMITHRTSVSCIRMDGSKESERDKLKLTFEACLDGEDVAVFRTWQLCVLVF